MNSKSQGIHVLNKQNNISSIFLIRTTETAGVAGLHFIAMNPWKETGRTLPGDAKGYRKRSDTLVLSGTNALSGAQ